MTTMSNDDWQQIRAKIIAKAWADDEFRSQFVKDPRAVISSMGIQVPEEAELVVHEDSADKYNLVIPSRPAEGEMSDADLDNISASGNKFCGICGL